MGALAGEGQTERISKAMHVESGSLPVMKGLRKDHKSNFDPLTGPPLQPLCNGKMGPNAPTANILAMYLRCLRRGLSLKGYNTEVVSTEELLHHIEKANIALEN